jgi:hypothetical protein
MKITEKEKNPLLVRIFNFATQHFALVAFLIYASGYIAWNMYLSRYGVVEYNFVQTRFLSAGLLLWIPIIIVFSLSVYVLKHFHAGIRAWKLTGLVTGALIGAWLGVFIFVFPLLPQSLGGARPIPISLLGTTEQIGMLANFGIKPASTFQANIGFLTEPLCLIYQNDQYVIVFVRDQATSTRKEGAFSVSVIPEIISLNRDEFMGFQTISNPDTYREACGLNSLINEHQNCVEVGSTTTDSFSYL